MALSPFVFVTLLLLFVSLGHCKHEEWRSGHERARPPMAAAIPSSRNPFEWPWFPTPPPFDLPPPSLGSPFLPPPDDGFEPPRRFFPRPPFIPFPPFSGPVQPPVAASAPAPSFEAPRYATPRHPGECFVLCLPRCLDRQCLRTCIKCCKHCKCVPFGSRENCKCYFESMYHGQQCP